MKKFKKIFMYLLILFLSLGFSNIVSTDGNFETYGLTDEENYDSQIQIVSPAQYLNTTTTYRMKAVISSKEITDVIWSSSNPSIASINSTTGVLSTKSTEGKFSVIATAADGSGMYGKIDLVVANVHVKVGESTSVGNSRYVTYSEVEWKIEDESILGKTGSYGCSR